MMLAIKSKFQPESVSFDKDPACETVWAKVTLKNKKTLFMGSYYRPPISQVKQLDELNQVLADVNTKASHNQNDVIMLGGDFNCGDICWDDGTVNRNSNRKASCEKLLNVLGEHHLDQMQRDATREDKTLDLFCTNKPSLVKACNTIPGLSDHEIVLSDCNLVPLSYKKPQRQIFQFSKADWDSIRKDALDFQEKYLQEHEDRSVEENWKVIKKYLDNLLK